MKMGAGLFWGILLVLLGISLIFKVVFHIHFPVFKIFIAFFFIFIGIKILLGDSFRFRQSMDKNDVIFSERVFNESHNLNKDYNVIFGKGVFDLSNLKIDENKSTYAEFNTVFGETEIWLDRNTPVKIKVESVFASARLPNGNSAVFGSNHYLSDNFDDSKPYLYLKADVVFGGLTIRYK